MAIDERNNITDKDFTNSWNEHNMHRKIDFRGENTDGAWLQFNFARIATNHLMHTFFPSTMLCMGSIMSVFVPSDLVPGRMGLCITSFLSMISLFNGARYW